jgi:hypothetical protein
LITPSDPLVRDAIAELDASDEDVFRRVRACLGRLHPEQAKVVLDGIAPTDGPGAVMGMLTLLDRIDGLAKSKNKADHAAVATLAKRGLDERERTRFRDLVRVAMKGTSEPEQTIDPEAEQRAQNRQRALVQLRAWYEDWSEMARSVIKRKDRLIRLGLARRKSPSSAGARNGPSKPPAIPANQPTDGATANASQG